MRAFLTEILPHTDDAMPARRRVPRQGAARLLRASAATLHSGHGAVPGIGRGTVVVAGGMDFTGEWVTAKAEDPAAEEAAISGRGNRDGPNSRETGRQVIANRKRACCRHTARSPAIRACCAPCWNSSTEGTQRGRSHRRSGRSYTDCSRKRKRHDPRAGAGCAGRLHEIARGGQGRRLPRETATA